MGYGTVAHYVRSLWKLLETTGRSEFGLLHRRSVDVSTLAAPIRDCLHPHGHDSFHSINVNKLQVG